MTLGPVTVFDKRNTATSKQNCDDAMSADCDVIDQFMANLEQSRSRILDAWFT